MEEQRQKEERMIAAFNEQRDYFRMMGEHHRAHGGAAVEPEVKKTVLENAKGRVLDAGCGEGSIALFFAGEKPDTTFIGVDISEIGVNMALERKRPNTDFKVCNLKQLPFDDGYFDFVYSQSVIEHIVDYSAALAEWRRVLKPGGKMLIRVSNGGRSDVKLSKAFLNYLFRRNTLKNVEPVLSMGSGSKEEHQENFDASSIPSDVLLNDLRAVGCRIVYFTTRRDAYLQGDARAKMPWLKRVLLTFIARAPFYPFTHLGPTIIVLAEKPA